MVWRRHLSQTLPPSPPPLELTEVVLTLRELRQVPTRLGDATPELRAELYRSMGIKVAYRREADREFIQVSARLRGVDLERVGGGT